MVPGGRGAKLPEPNAMISLHRNARWPASARTVLLKGLDGRGFVFYSNYESRKGRELKQRTRQPALSPGFAIERAGDHRGPVTAWRARRARRIPFAPRVPASWARGLARQSAIISGRACRGQALKALDKKNAGKECRCRRSGAATAWPPRPWNSGRAAAAACTTGSATAGEGRLDHRAPVARKGMQLYLIPPRRRGQRGGKIRRDAQRRGLRQVGELVAHFPPQRHLRPGKSGNSPLTRSEETAAVLAAGLNLAIPLLEQPGLEPEDDPRASSNDWRTRPAISRSWATSPTSARWPHCCFTARNLRRPSFSKKPRSWRSRNDPAGGSCAGTYRPSC